MKILVACEESQIVCKAFRAKGHEAFSCDIIDCSGGHPEWHIKDDVLKHVDDGWDMMIAFPPCTYISNAGARFLYPKGILDNGRLELGKTGKKLFMKLINANIPKICIENPIHSKIFNIPKHTQQIQPYEFGHPQNKEIKVDVYEALAKAKYGERCCRTADLGKTCEEEYTITKGDRTPKILSDRGETVFNNDKDWVILPPKGVSVTIDGEQFEISKESAKSFKESIINVKL